MSDDVERQLDEFYRKLDGSARRVEARWKSTPATESRVAAWLGAGVAAAAAILLMISALRSSPKPVDSPLVQTPQVPVVEPAPRPVPERPAPLPRIPTTAPVETPRPENPPPPPEPSPEKPAPPEPRTPEKPAPPPVPETPKPETPAPSPTKVASVIAVLREVDGSFELGDKGQRGKQKEFKVAVGDRLRATTPVKITLADDRLLLLAARTVLEFRPEEKRLSLSLEQGELLADLIGPGPEIRVVTKACEVTPLGTVFGVKVDAGRVTVSVEKGRVDVQSAKGRASLRAAEALQASEDGSLGAPVPADFRSLAWARSHRPAELTLFADDFSKPGLWVGEVEKGVAHAVPKAGSAAMLQIASEKPGLFEVPIRGGISVVCRSDRAGKFKIQLYSPELKTTYVRKDLTVLRGETWRNVSVDFDEFVPSDKSKPSRLPPGTLVTDLVLMYNDEPGPGNFWVDAIKVTELRP